MSGSNESLATRFDYTIKATIVTTLTLSLMLLTPTPTNTQTTIQPGFLGQVIGLFTLMQGLEFGSAFPLGISMLIDITVISLINTPLAYAFVVMDQGTARLSLPFLVFIYSFIATWTPMIRAPGLSIAIMFIVIVTTYGTGEDVTKWWRPLSAMATCYIGVASAYLSILLIPLLQTQRLSSGTFLFNSNLNDLKRLIKVFLLEMKSTETLDKHSTHALALRLYIRTCRDNISKYLTQMSIELTLLGSLSKRNELILSSRRLLNGINYLKAYLDIALRGGTTGNFHVPDVTNGEGTINGDERIGKMIELIVTSIDPSSSSASHPYDITPSNNLDCNAAIGALMSYHRSILNPPPPPPPPTFNPFRGRTLLGPLTLPSLKQPLKMAVCMTIASLFAVEESLISVSFGPPPAGLGWLAGLHAALICQQTDGGSYEKAIQRLIGNGLGCGFALIVYIWFQQTQPGPLVGLLVMWTFVVYILIRVPDKPYIAANASYTATIAIFGILGAPSNVLYVVMRLTLLMIAVVIVVAVEVLFFPVFPSDIVERSAISLLGLCADHIDGTCRTKAIRDALKTMKGNITHAKMEPTLGMRREFDYESFRRMIDVIEPLVLYIEFVELPPGEEGGITARSKAMTDLAESLREGENVLRRSPGHDVSDNVEDFYASLAFIRKVKLASNEYSKELEGIRTEVERGGVLQGGSIDFTESLMKVSLGRVCYALCEFVSVWGVIMVKRRKENGKGEE
ncbi:hypothetical protein TrCOL_g7294 [Triparma columacea]|uniref:Uncharacterized protein n=1 Tax=Triparma columacea TaxID=722753 RepID=A0A9W7GQ72_9STRA|nr:hypothetical protein TrCOL_g7294 [Triparma columacea]